MIGSGFNKEDLDTVISTFADVGKKLGYLISDKSSIISFSSKSSSKTDISLNPQKD